MPSAKLSRLDATRMCQPRVEQEFAAIERSESIPVINGHVNLAQITSMLCRSVVVVVGITRVRATASELTCLPNLHFLPHSLWLFRIILDVQVALPCSIIAPTIDDFVVLILWYKDDEVSCAT